MQMLKVRYVGKNDSIVAEYDGIKYSFSKKNPEQIIPLEVYNFMQSFNNPNREDFVPATDAIEEKKEEKKKTIEEDIAEIENSIIENSIQEEKKYEGKKRGRKSKQS
jgi:hypothetical protein